MNYNISKAINTSFTTAVNQVKEALQTEGFGVITEIDLKEKFKEKLNKDFRNYTILGACNPKLAYEAIQKEDTIGVMLPCNILIQEKQEGVIEIAAINPMESIGAVENKALMPLAKEVSEKLKKVIDQLQ